MSSKIELLAELSATAELCGGELSETAAQVMVTELSVYPHASVIAAMRRCRKEVTGRLALAHIIQRIDDGRPGAEEAWALMPKDEETTAVVTQEMLTAYGVARELLADGDTIGARMAFKETYARDCEQARACNIPVAWKVSLGQDKAGRSDPIIEAVRQGRITQERALQHLHDDESLAQLQAIAQKPDAVMRASRVQPLEARG